MGTEHDGERVLDREDCLRRLRRGGIGRVAVTVAALPAIYPVSYDMWDDNVVFAMIAGTKLVKATLKAVVAFEVDDIETVDHRWSVTVVGLADEITDDGPLARLRELHLAPWVGDTKAVAFVRIRTDLIYGRERAALLSDRAH
jgi:nitroimidazol reductase NimA-like FMN-containing flavoprotein (pyridoxamine 5'-phosphate oxidase superfamily)